MAEYTDFKRRSTSLLDELLCDFRAMAINGPRQCGKSTLLQHLQRGRGAVISLDDPEYFEAATNNPRGFLDALGSQMAIDEFQRGGNPLLLAIKRRIDSSNERGQYLLAGSTQFLALRDLAETLTGRIGKLDLMPLSVGERLGIEENFISRLFKQGASSIATTAAQHRKTQSSETETPTPLTRSNYAELIAVGGFPEMVLGSKTSRFRKRWCDTYLETVTARANVEQVANIRQPQLLTAIVQQIAARSGNELVVSDIARELNVSTGLVDDYLFILEALYMIRLLPAWTTSRTNRAKKRKACHVLDTAIAAHLLNESAETLSEITNRFFGPLLETFVVGEIAKQVGWEDAHTTLSHFRDRDGREVDIIIEQGLSVAAIEVKATASPRSAHLNHIRYLADKLGDRFVGGVLLHTGTERTLIDTNLAIAPVSALWE